MNDTISRIDHFSPRYLRIISAKFQSQIVRGLTNNFDIPYDSIYRFSIFNKHFEIKINEERIDRGNAVENIK
jgi:hypothetical protein